jgi:phage terminase small subunit
MPSGRQPFTVSDVVPYGVSSRRLRPPASLSAEAKRHFLQLVTTCPAAQFEASDLVLLCRWSEAAAMAERASIELQASGMLAADGKVSPHFAIYERATKMMTSLALRLRLGPQSRAPRAPKTKAAPTSYYDLMQDGDDADDTDLERS